MGFSSWGGDKAQLRSSVRKKPATVTQAATGSQAAGFSATGRAVSASEPQHTPLIPGLRQEEQLTTCLPTWEPLQRS